MPGKRIKDLTPLSGAGSANNDDVVIFDADADATKRISRSQLAEGMQGDVQVFSNKTINLGSNTLTGTTAQFNTALSDNNFATQAGSETLTNKTIDSANNTLTVNYKEARVETSDASRTHLFTTVAALLADTGTYTTYAAGQIVEAGGFRYEVAASGASDHHVTTAGGVKLYVQADGTGSARQWGVNPNAGVDVYAALQRALDNQDEVVLEEGVYLITRGLRQTRNGSNLRGAGPTKTIIRALSPTANNNFGGTDGNEAVVWALGGEGAPIYSLKCSDMTLDCAGLMTGLTSGDVRLKGHHYRRVQNFEVSNVYVTDCGSYAFWANDKTVESGGVQTGCSGKYTDCRAYDAQIAFETTGTCYITYNRPRAEQTRGTWAWPILEQYHFYGGLGQITVNDGYARCNASTIIGPLLTRENVIWNGGYYEQLNAGTTVINMSSASAKYDGWAFNDVTMVGAGAVGALSFGSLGTVDAKMTFKGGKYTAASGTGLTFTATTSGYGNVEMLGVDCKSTTAGGAVPFSLIVSGTFKSFHVFGGNQEAYGPAVGSSPVNAGAARFSNTKMVPASSVTETIRQSLRGSAAFANGGGFAQINFAIPLNVANKAKLVVTGAVEASATNATGAGEGVAYTWNNPSANIINILAPVAAVGRTFNYYVVEFE